MQYQQSGCVEKRTVCETLHAFPEPKTLVHFLPIPTLTKKIADEAKVIGHMTRF